jgi:glutathione synthase
MKLTFLVSEIATEVDEYTTTRLARAAARMDHEVWYVGVGDITYAGGDGPMKARAHRVNFNEGDDLESLMKRIKGEEPRTVVLDEFDAVFIRNESVDDLQDRPWASPLAIVFGENLKSRGVTVVNDPTVLTRAVSKFYLEEFPESVRPRSLVTRDADDIERFVKEIGHVVIKPVYGAKGRNVFMIEDAEEPNLNQMIEAVLQDGYAMVQEFCKGGEDGDARIFLLEGRVLEHEGQTAAFRRVPTGNDQRANISTGGRAEPLEMNDELNKVVEAMGDKLRRDGMFFVGIDVIRDTVVEINAESPGGMQAVERLYDVDVCPAIIDALEQRTRQVEALPSEGSRLRSTG